MHLELGKLHTITQDILENYLKPTRINKRDIVTYKKNSTESISSIRNAKIECHVSFKFHRKVKEAVAYKSLNKLSA